MSQSAPKSIKNGDLYEHKRTGLRACVSDNITTPTGCVRLVDVTDKTRAVSISLATLDVAWRAIDEAAR